MADHEALRTAFEDIWTNAIAKAAKPWPEEHTARIKRLFRFFFMAGADCCFDVICDAEDDGDVVVLGFHPADAIAMAEELDEVRQEAFARTWPEGTA